MAESDYFLDMEQAITKAGYWLWQKATPAPRKVETPANASILDDHRQALTVLLRVLSGHNHTIRTARDVGGLRGNDLLLPSEIHLAETVEENRSFYTVRVVLAAGWSSGQAPEPNLHLGSELDWIRRSCLLARRLAEDLPLFGLAYSEAASREAASRGALSNLKGRSRILESARQSALLGGEPWLDSSIVAGLVIASQRNTTQRDTAQKQKGASPEVLVWGRAIAVESETLGSQDADDAPPSSEGTEIEAPPVEELLVMLMDESDQMDTAAHQFEKVETLDNWSGGIREMDGSDELDDHLEALEDLDLKELIRGGEQAQSVYRADIALDISIPDVSRISPGEGGISYDEWDRKKRRYRKDWTTVFPTEVAVASDSWAVEATARWAREIEDLHWRLLRHRENLDSVKRRMDGEEIDLDAVVDELAAVRAGHGGNNRLYLRKERRHRDHATLVLIDISLSTDAWVQDRRVIDIAREAVLVLGEVTDRLDDQLRVMTFASHTRNQVRVWDILGWDEPWDRGRRRLGLLSPQGYTRIGPALRHATAELEQIDAKNKLMLLVTDGKPTDYDRYEGRYGIADVRQAIREASNQGIHVHALAVQSSAQDYLPAMLGPGGWDVLSHPNDLPALLTSVHGRMASM